jgi:hypothetical protein
MNVLPHRICALLSLVALGCSSSDNPATTPESGTPDATEDTGHPGREGGLEGGGHDGAADAAADGPIDSAESAADGSGDGTSSCPPPPQDAGTYGNTVLADQPLAYWRFDEPNGPTAYDSSGHCVNGTYKGAIAFGTTGALSKDTDTAVTMNGSNTWVDMGDVFPFLGYAPFSLELWVRPTLVTMSYKGLITKEFQNTGNTDREGYDIFQQSPMGAGFERYQNYMSDGAYCRSGALDAGGCTSSGFWVHFVATFDGGNLSFYQDGVLVGGPTAAMRMIQPTTGCSFAVGALLCGTTGWFSGDVDEVAVYDHPLSQARIQAHYTAAQQ